MKYVYIVTKSVVTDSRNRVESGQCLPDTDGWRLLKFFPKTGKEKTIFEGFYDHCTQLQQSLQEKKDIADEMKSLEEQAETRRKRNSNFMKRISSRLKGI
ncbi:MAG: hypothetical protein U5N86_03830 [Planctomycetota bacterium]|nr:hypothetical protein [Planctomycetota bacterium]